MPIRYVYAIKTGRGVGAKAFEQREVPAHLVDASTALTGAVQARLAGSPPMFPHGFAGLSDSDVASIFSAFKRKEVNLSGGRFTRVPTVWSVARGSTKYLGRRRTKGYASR